MPKIKINDINMYYEMHGSGEPIVFISGFSCDHTVWEEVAKKLQNNYQIILFDNRGAGQSDAPDQAYKANER
jgi:3-oxoadipate enol-lactonase